jgi:flavin-dependent dehydrogenase
LTAAFVIDAGGRTAPVASRLGAVRQIEDRLVCAYLYGVDSSPERAAGFTYVEAEENGWWYTAPLPGGRRVLAFHTDADMPAAGVRASGKELLNRAASRPGLARLLGECGFGSAGNVAFTAANSGRLKPFASAGWCAAGDAAMCFDPLSSQGLFNALYSGLAAAEAAEDFLSSGQESRQYSQALQRIYEVYRQNLACFYAAERRWSRVPFWQRRHALASHVVRD